jgi:nicotinamide riboside kinase
MKLLSEYFSDDNNRIAQVYHDKKEFVIKLVDKLKPNMDVEYAVITEEYAESVAEDWVS